jgi:hypothetical protein
MPDQYTFEHGTMRELRKLVLAVQDEAAQTALFAILGAFYDLAEAHYAAEAQRGQ